MAAPTMFEWLSNILEGGDDLMVDMESIKSYEPFVINRWLAQYEDCILLASELNIMNIDDKRMHYDYLRSIVRKRKRYVKWVKKSKADPNVLVVMEYYNIGEVHAKDYMTILTADQIKILKTRMDPGGNTRLNKKPKK